MAWYAAPTASAVREQKPPRVSQSGLITYRWMNPIVAGSELKLGGGCQVYPESDYAKYGRTIHILSRIGERDLQSLRLSLRHTD